MSQNIDKKYEHDRAARKVFRLRVVYNKKGCISAGHCVLSDPYDFKLDDEFKAILTDSKEGEGVMQGVFTKEIETTEPHLIMNAARTCTPRVIAVFDVETGKRIA
jgi:ferredoxin